MTNDEALRKACADLLIQTDRAVQWGDAVTILLRFARQQQAVGVRRVQVKLDRHYIRDSQLADWCDSTAKELEQG